MPEPAVPANMPTFLVVGAAKAGTSSLHHLLAQHPEVFTTSIKEPNFFALEGEEPAFRGPKADVAGNRHSTGDLATYQAMFAGAGDAKARGESSPLYLASPKAPARIRHHVPGCRLIAVLRDPAERAWSAYLHARLHDREPLDFRAALEAEPARIADNWEFLFHYEAGGRYADQVQRYFDVFPREQFRVLLNEDLRTDMAAVMRDLFCFIGVDPDADVDVSTRVNESSQPRSRALRRFLVDSQLPRRVARAVVPEGVRRRVWAAAYRRNSAPPPRLDPDSRALLVGRFRDDIERLEVIIGRDLAAWKR